jgi:hypothetical protein
MLFLKSRYSSLFWIAAVIVVIGMAILVDAKPPETFGLIGILLLFTLMRAVDSIIMTSW